MFAASGASSVAALVDRLGGGDERALRACLDAGHALGIALTSAVNLLDVGRIVLGGIFTPLYDWVSGPAHRVLTERLGRLRAVPVLAPSRLDSTAATLGAAGRVVHGALADPGSFVGRASGPRYPA